MKSYFTTASAIIFALFLLLQSSVTFAQENSLSPYTLFGLGDLNFDGGTPTNSMGGLSTPVASRSYVNFNNPASYSKLLFPVFDLGFKSQFTQSTSASSSTDYNTSQISNILLGFPIKKNMGLAFGLAPYSNVGYNLQVSDSLETIGNVERVYRGEGGINKAFIGFNRHFVKQQEVFQYFNDGSVRDTMRFNKHYISIGTNLNFLFGNLERTRNASFENTSLGFSRYTNKNSIRGVQFQFGAIYQLNLKERVLSLTDRERMVLSLGATYEAGSQLTNESSVLTEAVGFDLNQNQALDTISIVESSGKLSIPTRYSFGASLNMIGEKGRSWDIGLDLTLQDWSSFSVSNLTAGEQNFGMAQIVRFGVELTPDVGARLEDPLLRRTTYRIGLKMNDSYLLIKEQNISERSVTAGLSLPLTYSRTTSKINFGMEFGTRGTTEDIFLEESFSRIYLGISLSPDYSRNVWFRRRKYN